jgi:hypothetical protein
VCDSDRALRVDTRPVVMSVGGAAWTDHPGMKDQDTNIDYLMRVECSLCGYTLLFNCERFITGNTPALEPGALRSNE